MEEIIVRYLHFAGIIVLTAALAAEHMLIEQEVTPDTLRRLARLDAAFGLSALVVLLAGLGQWFWVGKPAAFYSTNGVFHAKVALFVVMGLLSIYPTLFFLKQRRSTAAAIAIPRRVIMVVRAELTLLMIIPLLAVIMARGIGSG